MRGLLLGQARESSNVHGCTPSVILVFKQPATLYVCLLFIVSLSCWLLLFSAALAPTVSRHPEGRLRHAAASNGKLDAERAGARKRRDQPREGRRQALRRCCRHHAASAPARPACS